MKKAIGTLLVTLLALALLVYSAMRSLDFISLTLPADQQVLAWFGLAALDGGLVIWLLNFLYGAKGGYQRGISLLMVIVDFLGAVAMFTLDTLYNTGQAGMTAVMAPEDMKMAVLALSAIIALNVGATLAHHIMDPDNRQRMAEEDVHDQIEALALKKISENTAGLAASLAPRLASSVMDDINAQYASGLKVGRNGAVRLPAPAAQLPSQLPSPTQANAFDAGNLLAFDGNDKEEKPAVLPSKSNPTPRQRKV